jgi:hypothetical protein
VADLHAELRPLCHATFEVGAPTVVGSGPAGTRLIAEITGARFEGERFKASLTGASSADWAVVEPDGRILADVRMLLRTDDDAVVALHYQGRGDAASGFTYSAPLFETGDERYQWLTKLLVVGKSSFDGTTLTYEMYEVA